MKILLVNDDGIFAAGIKALAKALSVEHDVCIAAPKNEMSSVGHHITMRTPLKFCMDKSYDLPAYAIEGTPADCVKFALRYLKIDVDVVISGINLGENVGSDVVYSGTVSAAIEASLMSKPAIAVSLDSVNEDNFAYCAKFVNDNLEKLFQAALPQKVINVNFPDFSKIQPKGIKVIKQGFRDYGDFYQKRGDEYFIKGTAFKYDEDGEECDVKYLEKGYITVTPLTFDMTDYNSLQCVEEIFK